MYLETPKEACTESGTRVEYSRFQDPVAEWSLKKNAEKGFIVERFVFCPSFKGLREVLAAEEVKHQHQ